MEGKVTHADAHVQRDTVFHVSCCVETSSPSSLSRCFCFIAVISVQESTHYFSLTVAAAYFLLTSVLPKALAIRRATVCWWKVSYSKWKSKIERTATDRVKGLNTKLQKRTQIPGEHSTNEGVGM